MSQERAVDIGVLLNVAFGVFKRELHHHLSDRGFDDLGPSHGYVFRLLERKPHNLQAVAAALGMTAQGALKIVGDMVAKGYVERQDDPLDGRVKWLVLTPRARQAMDQARRFHAEFENRLEARFGREQIASLRAVLEEIHANAYEDGFAEIRPL
jgi:DNA-binding MarR family transcriptional regulator